MRKKILVVIFAVALALAGGVLAAEKVEKRRILQPTGLFSLYEQNRESGVANYISSDLLLLSYGMLRRQDTILLEQNLVMPTFQDILTRSGKGLEDKKGSAADANRDFIAILSALLQGKEKVEEGGNLERATGELSLIIKAEGIAASPLWGYRLDYSQYKPRGAYDVSEPRRNYFRGMRYASSILFAVRESEATGINKDLADRLTEQALMFAGLFAENEGLQKSYDEINRQLGFRFGRPDDLVMEDLQSAPVQKAADAAAVRKLLFDLAVKERRQPAVLGNLVERNKLEEGVSAADALTGFRLFPQRYSSDSAFFQQLIAPEGGEYQGKKNPFGLVVAGGKRIKGFPSAYELMAQYGAEEADRIVEKNGEQDFSGYQQTIAKGRQALASAYGIDALHRQLLQVLFAGKVNDGQRLESGLAFWTWQRYVNLLYTKQSVTMTAKSVGLMTMERAGAVLEPDLSLYLVLSGIVDRFVDMQAAGSENLWLRFSEILKRCIDIASKEQLEVPLNKAEESFLNELDRRLIALTGGKDLPIIVDVHTEPSSRQVLEEGTGYPLVVLEGEARGGRLTHFEFKQPMDNRLTDSQWRAMIQENSIPKWQ